MNNQYGGYPQQQYNQQGGYPQQPQQGGYPQQQGYSTQYQQPNVYGNQGMYGSSPNSGMMNSGMGMNSMGGGMGMNNMNSGMGMNNMGGNVSPSYGMGGNMNSSYGMNNMSGNMGGMSGTPDLMTLFRMADANGDGKLDAQELQTLMFLHDRMNGKITQPPPSVNENSIMNMVNSILFKVKGTPNMQGGMPSQQGNMFEMLLMNAAKGFISSQFGGSRKY